MGLFGGKETARDKYLDAAVSLMPFLERLEEAGGSLPPSDPGAREGQRLERRVMKHAEKAGVTPGWLPPEQIQIIERMGHPEWPDLFQRFCDFITGLDDVSKTLTEDDEDADVQPGPATEAALRFSEIAEIVAQAASMEMSGKNLVLCSSALRAGGHAAALFLATLDDDEDGEVDDEDAEPPSRALREQMLLVAGSGSKDAVGRVISGLAWY